MASIAVQQEIDRNYRWNFTVNALDGGSWWFGMSFISGTVILPLYVSHFTNNPLLFGLISFLSTAGYLLPQLFVANWVERAAAEEVLPRDARFLPGAHAALLDGTGRLLPGDQPAYPGPDRLLPALCLAQHRRRPGHHRLADMVAKIIPVEKRGRFFGITNFIGNGAGILGALAVPFILERSEIPFWLCVGVRGGGGHGAPVVDFLSLTRERPCPAASRGSRSSSTCARCRACCAATATFACTCFPRLFFH